MRLTVGPLPPAVYWGRRSIVLGAILLFVLVIVYSCGGSDRPSANPQAANPLGSPQRPAPTVTGLSAQSGEPPPSDRPYPSGSPSATAGSPPAGQGAGDCTDQEINLAAVPARQSAAAGASVEIALQVKNISGRTCTRDLGSLQQELYLKLGAEKIWSSDTCSTGRDSDVKSLAPNIVHEYRIEWNGRESTRCSGGVASGPQPAAGSYLVFARLGTKLSEPAPLSLGG